MITLTLRTKRVFRAVGRSGLPFGQPTAPGSDRAHQGRRSSGRYKSRRAQGHGPARDARGAPVAWVSAGVMKSHDGCVLDLEEEWPAGVGVATGLPNAKREPRSYRHRPLGAP